MGQQKSASSQLSIFFFVFFLILNFDLAHTYLSIFGVFFTIIVVIHGVFGNWHKKKNKQILLL